MVNFCTFYLDSNSGEFKVGFNNEYLAYIGVDVEMFHETFSKASTQDFIEYMMQHLKDNMIKVEGF